jgi:hypothetical protein
MFSLQYNLFIKENVLTKDELESGWISTNRSQLNWSYYLLVISFIFIFINMILIFTTVKLKNSLNELKNMYETNINLIGGEVCFASGGDDRAGAKFGTMDNNRNAYQKINDLNQANAVATADLTNNNELPFNANDEMRSSKKLKRIIDFIY